MDVWQTWIIIGLVLMGLELIIPGGIVVFLGIASSAVAGLLFFKIIESFSEQLLSWFIISIFLIIGLRSFFIKYFEGDSKVVDVSEESEVQGSIVEVSEDVFPYKNGRVKFRNTSYEVYADEEILKGQKAVIVKQDGNKFLIKSI